MGDIFDIAEARGALVRRRESLVAECKACHEVNGSVGCRWAWPSWAICLTIFLVYFYFILFLFYSCGLKHCCSAAV